MRRRISLAVVPIALAALAQTGPAAAPAYAQDGAEAGTAQVVAVESVAPPRRKVIRHRFRPWARPSPRRVREIIRAEARRWHIDPRRLARRVHCESRFHWWASGGAFHGLLQFHASTFHRGLRTIKDRRVVLRRERVRRVHETRLVRYSDGRTVPQRGRRRRQRVVHVYTGKLPRRPELTHAWTQLRIGSQSIRGISAVRSSEWSCPA